MTYDLKHIALDMFGKRKFNCSPQLLFPQLHTIELSSDEMSCLSHTPNPASQSDPFFAAFVQQGKQWTKPFNDEESPQQRIIRAELLNDRGPVVGN